MNWNKMIISTCPCVHCPMCRASYSISQSKVFKCKPSPTCNSNLVSYACFMAQVKEEVEISPGNMLALADAPRAATLHGDKIRASQNR